MSKAGAAALHMLNADASRPGPADGPCRLDRRLRARLAEQAAREHRGEIDIGASIGLLRDAGWIAAARPPRAGGIGLGEGDQRACDSVRALIELAEANLSAARLFEGHVNALALVDEHADDAVRRTAFDAAAAGELLGVWGADGRPPVGFDAGTRTLTGVKRFASGLGTVSRAVVSLDRAEGVRLCLVDVTDSARQDGSTWRMSGMRATASGDFDFTGLPEDRFAFFGPPGAFHREPGFVGGVWRIAAIQLGGALALVEAARRHLQRLERLEAPAQRARLGEVLHAALGAIGLVERAAAFAGGPDGRADPERAVALSIFARLRTERVGQEAIAAVERSVGLAHFDAASATGRIARDLAVYMRQAAADAFLQRASATALAGDRDLAEFWYG